MVKTAKSTKKFAKKHLEAALKHRKKLKPMEQALRRKAAAAALRPHGEEEQPEEIVLEKSRSDAAEHKEQLESLKEKDPEFYEFLKEHDKELLDFKDEDDEEEEEEDEEDPQLEEDDAEGSSKNIRQPLTLSTALVDGWCAAVKDKHHIGALRNLLQAFRVACHYGDGEGDNLSTKYNITSSHVFNKVLVFVLCEADGALKHMLGLTVPEEKMDKNQGFSTSDLQKNKKWKKVEPFVKIYLGNSLHILNQMTDNDMIIFTLQKLKVSVPLIGTLPKLARKFLKVALHFWGSGDGALPVISFFFIREMALQLGEDMLEPLLKGIYKDYAVNAKFVNSASFPKIQFRAKCVVELYGIDLNVSYQLAFVFIRQMAIILRNAITMKAKDAFKSVYSWQYINSLHLWVKVICLYPGQDQLRPLLYPLAQILGGVAQLVPTARFFPLRVHCVKMLNELATATHTFTPVASLLLDMLQFKELHMSATGGTGKAIDFDTTLKVPKQAIKTRAFQEECVATVLEQMGEHLAQWSYAVAFPELAVIPLMQMRQFLKKMTVERFRNQVKQLIEQIERNVNFVWTKRDGVTFSPKDTTAVAAFLQTEKEAGSSPLSQYLVTLRQRAEQRKSYLQKDSVLVKDGRSKRSQKNKEESEDQDSDDQDNHVDAMDDDDDDQAATKALSYDWLSKKNTKVKRQEQKESAKEIRDVNSDVEDEGDIIEDLLFSSDDEVVTFKQQKQKGMTTTKEMQKGKLNKASSGKSVFKENKVGKSPVKPKKRKGSDVSNKS